VTLEESKTALWTLTTRHSLLELRDLDELSDARVRMGDAFIGQDDHDKLERLAIYNSDYVNRLLSHLTETFPAIARELGRGTFEEWAWRYLRTHPSTHPDLRWVGRHFPSFIEVAAAQQGAPLPPWLADLARLEWARHDVFGRPDCPALDWQSLCALPPQKWPSLALRFVPAFCVVRCRFDVAARWQELVILQSTPDRPPPEVDGSVEIAVWRRDVDVLHRRLDAVDGALHQALIELPLLEHATDAVARALGFDAVQTARTCLATLKLWTEHAWLARLESAATPARKSFPKD